MIFIDTSFYLALINPQDSTHSQALSLRKIYEDNQRVTSNSVLSELATVGAIRLSKSKTIQFIEQIESGKTKIITEQKSDLSLAWKLFKQSKSKNISWVDCHIVAISQRLNIKRILSFDKDIERLQRLAKKLT